MDFRASVAISRTVGFFHFLPRCGVSGFLKVQETGGERFRRRDRRGAIQTESVQSRNDLPVLEK